METFLGIVFGGLISVGVAIWVENLRRPKLQVLVDQPWEGIINPGELDARTLRVLVSNVALGIWGFGIVRAAALQCRGAISFHRYDNGQDIFGRAMAGR